MALLTVNWKPNRDQLRSFGTVCIFLFGALGIWAFLRHSIFAITLTPEVARKTAYALWFAAGLSLILRHAAPIALRPLYAVLTAISLPVGYVVSQVLLGVLFYFVITPIGLTLWLVGRDSLHRKLEPTKDTYWIPRLPVTDLKRYYRQF